MKSILFLLTLVLTTLARAADLPRVAVVTDSPEPSLAAFADFLSVSLASASAHYTLVERAEITKLAAEAEIQKLAADQRPAALAKLAKADGLIIIGADKGDLKLPKLTLRLTSTINGLVLRSLILGGKEFEFPEAANLAAGVLRFPCERLTLADAKPPIIISLLGIRPAFEADSSLETTLNLAVAQHLSAQSGIAVSERWRMNDLVFERSLAIENPEAFTTGTVLVDGSFSRRDDHLEASLRLGREQTSQNETIVVQSPGSDIEALARKITAEILSKVGAHPTAPIDTRAEGETFAKYGRYLLDRKQTMQAARAYESSIALGYGTAQTLAGRISAYAATVSPTRGIDSYPPDDEDAGTLRECPDGDFKEMLACTLYMVRYVNDMAAADWKGMDGKSGPAGQQEHFLENTLAIGQMALEAVCKRHAVSAYATDARNIRRECRFLVETIRKSKPDFPGSDIRIGTIYETPAETIEAYPRLFHPKHLSFAKNSPGELSRSFGWQFSSASLASRPIAVVDWTGNGQAAAETAWRAWLNELATSDSLINQVDALALRFQFASDTRTRDVVLGEYVGFMENHFDWLLGSEGQLSLKSFGAKWSEGNLELSNRKSFIELFSKFLGKVPWMEPDTYFTINSILWELPRNPSTRDDVFSKELARKYCEALNACIARMKTHQNWQACKKKEEYIFRFKKLMDRIAMAYPDIVIGREQAAVTTVGAVPIHAWLPGPDLTGGAEVTASWIESSNLRWDGSRLLVPLAGPRVISLDPATFSASAFAFPASKSLDWSMAVAGNSMLVHTNHKFYLSDYKRSPGNWKPLTDLSLPPGASFNFRVSGFRDKLYVGAIPDLGLYGDNEVHQSLVGLFEDGHFNWIISGNRRPEKHPLDLAKPDGFLGVFEGHDGRPLLLSGNSAGMHDRNVYDLESGSLVAKLGIGVARWIDGSGDFPLACAHDSGEIIHAYLFDPAKPKPVLLFRNMKTHSGLGGVDPSWNKVNPLFDHSRPEYDGETISMVWRKGKLWILKWDNNEASAADKHNPARLRLVCSDPGTAKAVVIPLRYDVSDPIRSLRGGNQDMARPVIDQDSLVSTPDYLFFAAGKNNKFAHIVQTLSPVLFHVSWKEVENWIQTNHPEFGKQD